MQRAAARTGSSSHVGDAYPIETAQPKSRMDLAQRSPATMNTNDSQLVLTVDERKTRELCGQERDRLRCIRPKGHADEHEAITPTEARTWK